MIAENIERITSQIREATRKSGRADNAVTLVAVTKQVPLPSIRAARAAGLTLFGENKIQEAREKIEALGSVDYHWHFIGHLQKNKVKYLDGMFQLIHSVDDLDLAALISKNSSARGEVTPVLAQINVSAETTKFGLAPDRLEEWMAAASKLPGIQVRGLMAIPPFDPDPERSRPYFARLREFGDEINRCHIESIELTELSMGMSNDFQVAIEEGATLVRVGTALFGERLT